MVTCVYVGIFKNFESIISKFQFESRTDSELREGRGYENEGGGERRGIGSTK